MVQPACRAVPARSGLALGRGGGVARRPDRGRGVGAPWGQSWTPPPTGSWRGQPRSRAVCHTSKNVPRARMNGASMFAPSWQAARSHRAVLYGRQSERSVKGWCVMVYIDPVRKRVHPRRRRDGVGRPTVKAGSTSAMRADQAVPTALNLILRSWSVIAAQSVRLPVPASWSPF